MRRLSALRTHSQHVLFLPYFFSLFQGLLVRFSREKQSFLFSSVFFSLYR